MDNEILEQLQHIGVQLEKITKLLEESKAASVARKESFAPRSFDRKPFGKKPFGDKKGFGGKKSFGDKKGFGKKDLDSRTPRFDDNGKPRFIVDGRSFGKKEKRF